MMGTDFWFRLRDLEVSNSSHHRRSGFRYMESRFMFLERCICQEKNSTAIWCSRQFGGRVHKHQNYARGTKMVVVHKMRHRSHIHSP